MYFFLIVLLALVLEQLLAASGPRVAVDTILRRLRQALPARSVAVALGGLVVTFGLEIAIVTRAARSVVQHVQWAADLPIPLTLVTDPYYAAPRINGVAFVALSLIEAALLAIVLLGAAGRPWQRSDTIASAIAAVLIAAVALSAPAMTSGDMYAYVADASLGIQAYSPPATALPGEYAVIHHIWNLPLLPAAYGPLWLWWNSAVVGLVSGLHAKLLVLRMLNVGALLVALIALRTLGVRPALIAATAANPAIAFYYLTNGHNDLSVIAVILVAMTFAARAPVAAGIVAAIGASVKLTLVIPAAAVALTIGSAARRGVYLAVMLAGAGAIAIGLGGKPYFHALTTVAKHYGIFNGFARVEALHIIVAVLTVGLLGSALLNRRTFASVAFGFIALAQAFYPWYAIWGLPYAAARATTLTLLLIGFPLVTAALDTEIQSKIVAPVILAGLLAAIIAAIVWRGNSRQPATG